MARPIVLPWWPIQRHTHVQVSPRLSVRRVVKPRQCPCVYAILHELAYLFLSVHTYTHTQLYTHVHVCIHMYIYVGIQKRCWTQSQSIEFNFSGYPRLMSFLSHRGNSWSDWTNYWKWQNDQRPWESQKASWSRKIWAAVSSGRGRGEFCLNINGKSREQSEQLSVLSPGRWLCARLIATNLRSLCEVTE